MSEHNFDLTAHGIEDWPSEQLGLAERRVANYRIALEARKDVDPMLVHASLKMALEMFRSNRSVNRLAQYAGIKADDWLEREQKLAQFAHHVDVFSLPPTEIIRETEIPWQQRNIH